jgi:hypothetical protein
MVPAVKALVRSGYCSSFLRYQTTNLILEAGAAVMEAASAVVPPASLEPVIDLWPPTRLLAQSAIMLCPSPGVVVVVAAVSETLAAKKWERIACICGLEDELFSFLYKSVRRDVRFLR